MSFEGKVAFITGGGIGMGRAFGLALADRGADIAIADTDKKVAEAAAAEIEAKGRRALALDCDVSDPAAVAAAVDTTGEVLGGVDILINNAARHFKRYGQPFSKLTQTEIHELFDVNVFGVINCSLAVRESMQSRGGGVIINIASNAGHRVQNAYGVTKLAVRGLTQAFARDFAPDGTRVNAISPGFITTENAVSLYGEDHNNQQISDQLVKRVGTMQDIVNAMLYLSSDGASFVTGQTLQVNGGRDLYV